MRKIFFLLLTLGLLLAGCSVSEMNDTGMVNVSIGGDDGRYISGGSSNVDEAYLGLIDKDVLYNFEEMENVQAESDGTILHTFAGIPVGDYTFLALLLDVNDDNVAMAMDGVTIEEGLNQLEVEMGPGFTMKFSSLELELDDVGDEFTVEFNGNEITVGISIDALIGGLASLTSFEITVMDTNAKSISVRNWDDTITLATVSYSSPGENSFADGTFTINNISFNPEFMIRMESWGTVGGYADEKGYKDYKFRLEFF